MNTARFLHRTSRAEDALLVEAVLPGGTITNVFRNVRERRVVLQGSVDRVKWTLDCQAEEPVEDVVEFTVPKGYNFEDVSIMEKFARGRVLLRFPRDVPQG